jgi:6-pyruvoyl-tetrahydropterin synthase related domain
MYNLRMAESRGAGKRIKRLAPGILVLLVFAVLAVVFTRPLLARGSDHTYRDPHDPTFQAWTLAWDIRQLTHDPMDLFNANIFAPNSDTLAYSDHQVATAVMAMPLMAVTGNPVQTANYMLVFNFFLCEVGAYLLVLHLTRSRAAGVFAGVAFAFAPPRLAHVQHLQLSAAAFIPLCLLFMHRYSEEGKPRDAALAALFLALETLSTWYYGMILAFAILVFLVVRLLMNRKAFTLKWIATLTLVMGIAVLLVVPFGIPYLHVGRQDTSFHRSIKEVDLFSADLRDFTAAPQGNLLWGGLTKGARKATDKRGGPTERTLFPGLVPLLLGAAGAAYLFVRGKGAARFDVRYYVALAAGSFVMCLGSSLYLFGHRFGLPMPYDLFYYAFPGFKVMRVPPRFIILIVLSLAVLSGFAVKGLLSRLGRKRGGAALSALVFAALLALLLVDYMPAAVPLTRVPLKGQFPAVYSWLRAQPGEAPTAELPLADYDPGTFRAGLQYERTWAAREAPRTYYSTLHWKKIFNGYSGFIPATYYEGVKATSDFPSRGSIDFLRKMGMKYVIVHGKELEPERLRSVLAWDASHDDFNLEARFNNDYVFNLAGP